MQTIKASRKEILDLNVKISDTSVHYRGFSSIDQEIEREIAMKWFKSTCKTVVSQRNFLLKER